jgi:long-chain acyl-CoA synthetase
MSRHLLEALLENARQRPDAIAVRATGQPTRTWNQLAVEVSRTACLLASLIDDHGASNRIVYLCDNTIADVIVSLACIAAGAIEIPIDSRLPGEMQTQIIHRSSGITVSPAKLITQVQDHSNGRSIAPLQLATAQIDVHRPSIVLWTSGTTAEPRGVMLSQHNLLTNAQAKLKAVPQAHDDVRLSLLSIAHAYARTCDMGTWLLSGCQWTLDLGGRGLDCIDANCQPTLINSVPVLARQILTRLEQDDPSLTKLRVIGCGGAALDTQSFERFRQHGVEVIQGYGCTETSPVICSASPGDTLPGLVGTPIDDCEIRIQDCRLFVRGPMVMLGYLDDPEATSQKIDSEGWLDTGDLVKQHVSGQLSILGRADDVLVLDNGFKVHPLAIEQAIIAEHPCEHVVLMAIDQQLVIAVQGGSATNSAIKATVSSLLPPHTPLRVESLKPPLSPVKGELTAKNTLRRQVIRQRYIGQA